MFFKWLKHYLPRGLYGRAALILILPVVTLQLVVSVVFVQRHFEGVTRQMNITVAREVRLMLDQVNAASTRDAALRITQPMAQTLQIDVSFDNRTHPPDQRRWYDLSGVVVIRTLNARLPELLAVEMPDDRQATIIAQTRLGPVRLLLDRRRISASNPHQLFVNMIVFGALMTVIAFVYLRNQLRPITRLARAAEAFGRGRHLPYKPSGATEVRAAGGAFLDMRARIERQIEQRTLMLSGVSHDMRTPLTRMKLGLAMLEDEDREPLERDVEDMQRLLDEFLSFARGTSEGNPEKIDPHEMVKQIIGDCTRAGINATLIQSEGQGTIILRPTAIRRAVENLINNAVRYGTRAEVSVVLTDKSLRIRVEDDGPGIPPEKREDAVRPFVRLDASRNQNSGPGVGLGLAIATDIARSHGGVLRLGESQRLGGLCADIVIAR